MHKPLNKNEKREIPLGFKLIRAYFIIIVILNLFDLFKGGLQTLTTILLIIVAGVIVFCINKRYKFGQYVIYIATLFSALYALTNIIIFLTSKNPINSDIDFMTKAVYLVLAMFMVDIIINVLIFLYTYKHREYFIK